ncbi:Tn7 transposase TnsA N-terminal domain-containing protein [Malaciobacter marinus]
MKTNKLISFESKLERDFLYLFEYENFILNIIEQPIKINYVFENKEYSYTPDFYLETPINHKNIIVEVKYYDELKKLLSNKKENAKYKATIKYLNNKDIDFIFLTNRCTYIKSDEYKFNINFLLNYNVIDKKNFQIIVDLYVPQITIQELLNLYTKEKFKQLELINTIWCMIRRKILTVDMYEKLTLNSRLLQLKNYDEKVYQAHLQGRVSGGYLL